MKDTYFDSAFSVKNLQNLLKSIKFNKDKVQLTRKFILNVFNRSIWEWSIILGKKLIKFVLTENELNELIVSSGANKIAKIGKGRH